MLRKAVGEGASLEPRAYLIATRTSTEFAVESATDLLVQDRCLAVTAEVHAETCAGLGALADVEQPAGRVPYDVHPTGVRHGS